MNKCTIQGREGHLNKKAFTLIELLAVIVILAIIALIAVPIVLNIINDSKEQARERSAELYEKAVLNAVMQKQLDGKTIVPDGTYTVMNDGSICLDGNEQKTCLSVEVEGERPASGSTITIENGKVTAYSLTISGKTITPTNGSGTGGEKYGYMWYKGSYVEGPSINGDGSSLETELPDNILYYLKYKLNSEDKVINAYACVKFNGTTEQCLEGGFAASLSENLEKLHIIEQLNISGVSCDFDSHMCTNISASFSVSDGAIQSCYGNNCYNGRCSVSVYGNWCAF